MKQRIYKHNSSPVVKDVPSNCRREPLGVERDPPVQLRRRRVPHPAAVVQHVLRRRSTLGRRSGQTEMSKGRCYGTGTIVDTPVIDIALGGGLFSRRRQYERSSGVARLHHRKSSSGASGGGAQGGVLVFVACLRNLAIDHASLSNRSSGPAPDRDTSNFWALNMWFAMHCNARGDGG